ncbi:MAG: Zinc-dependent sulfurtransferase SufU [Opitutia bacterium UBA7350]|nr:MAG: Zinc-dependent sulfurtransferase SufU [Opitutae bacterium UBA7350]
MNDENAHLTELYQATILEHNKNPRHYGILPDHTEVVEGFNPLCGDKITFYLKRTDGKLKGASFECAACAICKASASILLDEAFNKGFQNYKATHARGLAFLEGAEAGVSPELALSALGAVRAFPARVNCARLAWDTLKPN